MCESGVCYMCLPLHINSSTMHFSKCQHPLIGRWPCRLITLLLLLLVERLTSCLSFFHYTDLFSAALPDLNLELVTTNYLGEPLDWKLIKAEIMEALSKPTFPRNAPTISIEEYDLYFGVQVTEFVMQDAKEIGLWSGQYPNNKRKSTLKDRCALM